jgi:hypothetical protein
VEETFERLLVSAGSGRSAIEDPGWQPRPEAAARREILRAEDWTVWALLGLPMWQALLPAGCWRLTWIVSE